LNLQLEANSIEVLGKDPENSVTPQEQQKIVELSHDPWIHRKIVNSIAPSIYGYEYIKEAIMYLLFGGVTKHLVDITVRGEANILLIGDPGTAKSQLLQYIPKITPRGIYTSGKGSSLDYNENILIRRNGEVSFVKIGAFVESEQSRQLEASYVFPTLEALSLNVKSAKLEWKKITALQSHVCNDYVYTVKIETGRQVTTSKDHSIYVLKNSKIYPAAVENLKVGDCVLIPRSINQETRDFPADIARLIGYYIADGHLYKNKKHYANRLTFDFCEEKDGEYVADVMNILKKYLEQKYLPPSIQKVSGKISIAFQTIAAYEFMKNWLGETYAEKVHTKRIPNAILNSNSIARRNFVKGYFAGDGGTTVSKGLMSDLLYLYLQEGIIATSTYRKASNNAKIKGREIHSAEGWQLRAPKLYHPFESKEIYSRIPYDALNSVTLSKLQTEQDERVKTKFLRRKWRIFAERCQSLLEKDSKQLSVEWSISVRNVSQYLRKKAKAGLVVKVLNKYSLTENGKEEIEDFANLQRLINSDIGFAHICEILKVQPTKPLVYDLSVEGNENFVGGFGGIICHNSGVGLTAAVVKNKDSSLSLEAGAMVLADKGILMIDEFEKMKPEDRVAIHEAMEQHTVSVAKGGIVATLNARTSILAAANPVLGRYDPYKTVLENVSLPVTLLSRFDLIFIIKDVPDKAVDDLKAEHILQIHRTHASPIEPAINRPMLKKYIAYAKTIDPILSLGAMQHLKEFYLKMRSATDNGESPVAITARQLESLVRIAEARARVALRKEVSVEDAEAAIKIMQKSLEDVGIDSSSYKIDIDLIMTGKPKSARDKINAILTVVADLNKGSGPVSREEIIQQLEDKKIPISKQESEKLISQMLRESILYEPREGLISKT
jgi:intein/homing endonuclease/MoxR-like ATPase